MPKYVLKKPLFGIDQLSDETSLRFEELATAVREALNVDIDRNGNVSRRKGSERQVTGSGYHSLYSSKRGALFACHRGDLGVYNPDTTTFTTLVTMNDALKTSFDELNGNVYAANPSFSCYFPAGSFLARDIGVSLPATTPKFIAVDNGNLLPGTYGITYTIISSDGEESGTGPVTTVEIDEPGGGVSGTFFEVLAGAKYRIYMTTADGEEFYQAVEFEADSASFAIRDHEEGRQPRTAGLEPLPYGHIIRAYNSRLYVASTNFVYFSDIFRPHLHNPVSGFIPVTGFVTMLQPVDGGVFIGDQRGVRFYAGDDPTEFQEREVSHEVPVFGTAIAVPGEHFGAELGARSDKIAVWLTTSGMSAGTSDGQLIRLHNQQVKLPQYSQGCAAIVTRDGRKQVIMPVSSNVTGSVDIAEDSVLGI